MNSNFRTIELSDPGFEKDGLRWATIKSPSLGRRADVCLWLPEGYANFERLPYSILLHGVYGSHWSWALKGGAHVTLRKRIAEGKSKPMALVMPSDGLWGDGSGYVTHAGFDAEAWIMKDLPAFLEETFSCFDSHSPLYLSGLSMGGYGALRLACKYPGQVSAVSAHSSCTEFKDLFKFVEEKDEDYCVQHKDCESVFYWAQKNKNRLPPIRFDCGVSDLLIDENRRLHEQLSASGIQHQYCEYEGEHCWAYWEKHIGESFEFFETTGKSP